MPAQQKVPLSDSLNALALRAAQLVIDQLGKALPCSVVTNNGTSVVIKFEVTGAPFTLPQVTVPVAMSQYVRFPTKKGTKGLCLPADYYIGNVSGLGSPTPGSLVQRANLSQLVFLPISNKSWANVDFGAVVLADESETTNLAVAMMGVIINNSTSVAGNLTVSNGASGTVVTGGGQVMTIQDGIVTNIF